MSTALTMFDNLSSGVPAHVANFFDAEESNIADKATVPSLTIEGKIWGISIDGNKTKLLRRNSDGDEEPVSTMRVVILDYAKRRGRAYYEGEYDPAKIGKPVCWSDDGIAPDKSVSEPQASKCESCPLAVKGSKVSAQGKAVTACSQHRMLAVVPSNKLDFTPLRLKIAMTSDFDKQSPDHEAQGWFAFSNYTDFIKSKGVNHSAALVTKMKFDPNAAYPKILFSPDRWLEPNELAQVASVIKSEEVQKLLGGTFTPNGADGTVKTGAQIRDENANTPEPKAEPRVAKPQPVQIDDDDDVVIEMPVAASKPAEKAEKKAPAKKAEAPAPVSTDVPDDVASLLADWGAD